MSRLKTVQKKEVPVRIELKGIRQHTLKNLKIQIPLNQMTFVTGVSGSGKTSLAFDTLFAEGQRRFIESLSAYTRQFLAKFPKPDVDVINHIPPAIALEQYNPIVNSRSLVVTQTEIFDFLKILFARGGQVFCEDCQTPSLVQDWEAQSICDQIFQWMKGKSFWVLAPFLRSLDENVSQRLMEMTQAGFHRIIFTSDVPLEMFEIQQSLLISKSNPEKKRKISNLSQYELNSAYWVIDRISLAGERDPDLESRLLDSIEKALAQGGQRLMIAEFSRTADPLEIGKNAWIFQKGFRCGVCRKEKAKPQVEQFSFSSPQGACPQCQGFGFELELDEKKIIPNPQWSLKNGAIEPLTKPSMKEWQTEMLKFANRNGISLTIPYEELTAQQQKLLWEGGSSFIGIQGCFKILKKSRYKLHISVFIRRYQKSVVCRSCSGRRLQPQALCVKWFDKNIDELCSMTIEELQSWCEDLESQSALALGLEDIFYQLKKRLKTLMQVGLGYLSLSRLTKTLSGGEFQRIQLATQLGSGLCGTLYILDEPSIGLHASDTQKLLEVLTNLKEQGNTLVIVEHDLEMIDQGDYVIELGPLAGREGGQLVFEGPRQELLTHSKSLTARYLNQTLQLKRKKNRTTRSLWLA